VEVHLISGQTIKFDGADRYDLGDEMISFYSGEKEEIACFWRGYVVGVYPATAVMKPDKPMPIEAATASEAAEEDD
jgi:hypothetical protein